MRLILISGLVRVRQERGAAHARGPRLLLHRQHPGGAAQALHLAHGAQPRQHVPAHRGGPRRPQHAGARSPRCRRWSQELKSSRHRLRDAVPHGARRRTAAPLRRDAPQASDEPRQREPARSHRPGAAHARADRAGRRTSSSIPRAWACTTCARWSAAASTRAQPGRISILFESFGFKYGIPGDADFVFDARSLPNPYWEPELRKLTGRDAEVARFLETQRRRAAADRATSRASSRRAFRNTRPATAATSPLRSAAPAASIARCTWSRRSRRIFPGVSRTFPRVTPVSIHARSALSPAQALQQGYERAVQRRGFADDPAQRRRAGTTGPAGRLPAGHAAARRPAPLACQPLAATGSGCCPAAESTSGAALVAARPG